jgi:hypothetical protein
VSHNAPRRSSRSIERRLESRYHLFSEGRLPIDALARGSEFLNTCPDDVIAPDNLPRDEAGTLQDLDMLGYRGE